MKAAKIECDFVPCISYLEWCGIHLDQDKWRKKMIADKEANGARYGLDLTARDYESSWERTSKICLPIVFETKHYLFPSGQKQLNEMKNFTQNQGW